MTNTPESIMEDALWKHRPVKTFAMFSGGNDSMVSTHFAMNHGATEVLHINTGIGIRQTREFVRETCKAFGWPLREVHPPAKSYREFVLEKGFPGPGAHIYPYSWLKERALRRIVAESKLLFCNTCKRKGNSKCRHRVNVALATGVRNTESARRMGFAMPYVRTGCTVWIAPLFTFSKLDLAIYRNVHGLPMSEVSAKLGFSGECLCGAFAEPGEFQRIVALFPEAAQEISALEDEARAVGQPHCIWGVRPSKPKDEDNPRFMPMCVGCNESKRRENR
jgi:3'-phosphoadenosine 5'-phosphosulfate sulfotransferase (PAPS reductase)/FAD synthetase